VKVFFFVFEKALKLGIFIKVIFIQLRSVGGDDFSHAQ
jgi:hypothetical protein